MCFSPYPINYTVVAVTIREECTEIVSQSQAVYVENSERKYNYKKALYVR